MASAAALPFKLKCTKDEFGAASMTTTTETVHGLLKIEGEYVEIQWRLARRTEKLGAGINASDLEAFEGIAGPDGLRLSHPAQLVLGLKFRDRLPGEEVAAELDLAVAKVGLEPPPERGRLTDGLN